MNRRGLSRAAVLCLSLLVSGPSQAAELQVAAAASLTDALQEVGAAFEAQSGHAVSFNFAASSLLALQIQEGAPADVFIAADEDKLDKLEQQGLLIAATRKSLLSNTLVVIVARDSSLVLGTVADLAGPQVEHIALAEPSHVPAGIYAKQYLQAEGLWPSVRGRVVPLQNVRAVLAAVQAGHVAVGVVYKTDTAHSKQVRIAWEVPGGVGPRICYPAAVVAASKNQQAARDFLAYLQSPAALAVFQRHGFLIP